MKFATMPDGTKDGRLHLVNKNLSRCQPSKAAKTMLEALENWDKIEGDLQAEYRAIDDGQGEAFDQTVAMAPLPRAWQWLDASAYQSHGDLMDSAFGFAKKDPVDFPFMYQGMSNQFNGPTQDQGFRTEDDGIDFEAEFGVLTSEVPFGADTSTAGGCIRLLVQINDWSLRRLAPIEMKTGFGWIRAKPANAMAPVAVTPDEICASWRDMRIDLPLNVTWNDTKWGAANGYEMSYGFDQLIAHAAYSRELPAGTVLGGGTVSNPNFREVGSSCIAERRGIEILDDGQAKTPFMSFGDTVKMEVFDAEGNPVFGTLKQQVIKI